MEKFETRNEDALNFGSDSTEALEEEKGIRRRMARFEKSRGRGGEEGGARFRRVETRSTFAHAYE